MNLDRTIRFQGGADQRAKYHSDYTASQRGHSDRFYDDVIDGTLINGGEDAAMTTTRNDDGRESGTRMTDTRNAAARRKINLHSPMSRDRNAVRRADVEAYRRARAAYTTLSRSNARKYTWRTASG